MIPLYTPECRQLPKAALQPQDQPLHGDPRDPGQGADARRDQPVLLQGPDRLPLHGLLDLLELHGAAGDRGGEDPHRRPLRQGLLHRLRRDDGRGRGRQHRRRGAGRQLRGVRPWRDRPERDPGREDGRRLDDRRRRHQPGARGLGPPVRHDPFRESPRSWPKDGRGRSGRPSGGADRRRRGLHLRLHGQHHGDAPGAGSLPPRLGREHHHRWRG